MHAKKRAASQEIWFLFTEPIKSVYKIVVSARTLILLSMQNKIKPYLQIHSMYHPSFSKFVQLALDYGDVFFDANLKVIESSDWKKLVSEAGQCKIAISECSAD